MKKKSISFISVLIVLGMLPFIANAQREKDTVKKYFQKLPSAKVDTRHTYRMTALYINRDLYGNFISKIKITGDYTHGLDKNFVAWQNVNVTNSNAFTESFPEGTKQTYMENFTYVPSPKMLEPEAFKDFPSTPDAVLTRNLVWDMMAIESFAWDFTDSLKLNKPYRTPHTGSFAMADIGTYDHQEIQVCWTGISLINDELCAVIEYRALDNKVEMLLEGFKTRGTEQYWGTTWISLKTKSIEAAVMFSGTIQELEIAGMKDKMLIKTIRDIRVEKIR